MVNAVRRYINDSTGLAKNRTVYRVNKVGNFKTRALANKAAKLLKSKGLKGKVSKERWI